MSKNILNLSNEEIEEFVVPFNKAYRKAHPFSFYAIKCSFYDFMYNILGGDEEKK
jgi:hypothetical protein